MGDKNVIIPYVRMGQIIEFIRNFPAEEVPLQKLQDKFGKSSVQNVLPTVQLLQLCEYDRKSGIVKLTTSGKKFRSLIITGDEKRAAEIIKSQIEESEALSFVKSLLERKSRLSTLEIGRELAFRFNKKWDNPLTYKAHGAACASILAFAGFGVYARGILMKDRLKVSKAEITAPYAGFEKIVKIVEIVSTYGDTDIHTLAKEIKTKKGRLSVEIKNCIDLGFLERLAPGRVRISTLGKDLIDPLKKHKRKEIFREALLSSNFSKIISSLAGKVFDVKELGEILKYELGGKWLREKTVVAFGKKFLNWLKSAMLLEGVGKGKYRIRSEIIKRAGKPQLQILSKEDYYTLGKNVGAVLFSREFDKVKLAVEKLLKFCEQDKNLSTVSELLQEHYKLFLDLKDSRIFHADIKLLERVLELEENGGVGS